MQYVHLLSFYLSPPEVVLPPHWTHFPVINNRGSSVWGGGGGKVSQIDTHKPDISTYIERTMSYITTI